MTHEHTAVQVRSSGWVSRSVLGRSGELVSLPRKALAHDDTSRLRFVVHATMVQRGRSVATRRLQTICFINFFMFATLLDSTVR